MGIIFCRKKENIEGSIILCNYSFQNKEQKKHIIDLIEKFEYSKPVKFILQQSNTFSISLKFNNKNYNIQTKTIDDSLNDIYKIIKPELNHPSFSASDINIMEDHLLPVNSKKEDESNEKIEKLTENKNDLFRGLKYIRFTNFGIQKIEMLYKYGNVIKELIKEEIIVNSSKFIQINDALKLENQNKELFALGLLGKDLEENGLKIFIQKDIKENEEEESQEEKNEHKEILQLITNRIYRKKKYILFFDFGREKKKFLDNSQSFVDFEDKIKTIIIREYNITENDIIVNILEEENIIANVIFLSNEFDNLDLNEFTSKLKGKNRVDELKYLKKISSDIIIKEFKLSKKLLDSRGNKFDDWPINESRGNNVYDPPLGWIGIGLKVMDLYDNGDNTWIGIDNNNSKWCVAYCRIGDFSKDYNNSIITSKKLSGSSERLYFATKIKIAEKIASVIKANNKIYKILLMARIKENSFKKSSKEPLYFNIENVSDKIIRPYRILYKEVLKN